jgi:hypothetical protein
MYGMLAAGAGFPRAVSMWLSLREQAELDQARGSCRNQITIRD